MRHKVDGRVGLSDTLRLVRDDLKRAFPGRIFWARTYEDKDGSEIGVSWDGGPSVQQVEAVVGKYHSARWDKRKGAVVQTGAPYANSFIFFHRSTNGVVTPTPARPIAQSIRAQRARRHNGGPRLTQ